MMNFTRLFTDSTGNSRFENVAVDMTEQGMIGRLSDSFSVSELRFRENDPDYDWDFHNAPSRQFILLLDGEIEITTSLGESRVFRGGDIILAEDVTGKGHKTRQLSKGVRRSVFVVLND